MPLESERMNQYSNDDNKKHWQSYQITHDNTQYRQSYIHSATDGAKQERAHEKEPAVTEGSQKGSWQIKRTNNFGDDYNDGNFGD